MNSKDEDSNLPTNVRYVIQLCKQIIKDAQSGKCTEEQINNIIAQTEPRCHGFINPRDYLSAEKAMKKLNTHRNQFFTLIKKYNIQVHKINNQPIGYHIDDINKLKSIIS